MSECQRACEHSCLEHTHTADSVLGVSLFGNQYPDYFNDFSLSFMTLFRIAGSSLPPFSCPFPRNLVAGHSLLCTGIRRRLISASCVPAGGDSWADGDGINGDRYSLLSIPNRTFTHRPLDFSLL